MKKVSLLLVASIVTMLSFGQTTSIAGKWKTEDNSIVEVILSTAKSYFVTQISAGKEKDKPFNGKVVGKGFTGANNEYSGTVIDPSNNKEYGAKLIISADGKSMKLRVKWGLLSFNEKWIKQ
jgi:uncharacterized protein (DUF2147 family)